MFDKLRQATNRANFFWWLSLLGILLNNWNYSADGKETIVPVIPQPQEVKLSKENFILNKECVITLKGNYDDQDIFTAKLLQEYIEKINVLKMNVKEGNKNSPWKLIVISKNSSDKFVSELADISSLDEKFKNEGYILDVSKDEINIASVESAGLYYGVQTLRQLLENKRNGNAEVRGVNIKDRPDMSLRGVFCITYLILTIQIILYLCV